MSDLLIPGRKARDYNSISHYWTFEDLTGNPLTSFDMFFGNLQGGTGGLNPAMDKYYRLENLGIMLRHISPTNPLVTVAYRRQENGANNATFSFTPTNRASGVNRAAGQWSLVQARDPGGSYNISVTIAASGIAFVEMGVLLSWRTIGDFKL